MPNYGKTSENFICNIKAKLKIILSKLLDIAVGECTEKNIIF